jgi:hypothetical protein
MVKNFLPERFYFLLSSSIFINIVCKVYSAMRYGIELCDTNYSHSKHLHLPDHLDMCICLHTNTHTVYITYQFLRLLVSVQNTLYNKSSNFKCEGTAVAQWLRYCATNRKVTGSIPDGVIGFFH